MKYRFVFFDVDSTLVTIEGIDVLAGGNPDIARLTAAAMNGEVPLDDVYARRLEIIRPTRAQVDALAQQYLHSLVDDAEEVVATLLREGRVLHLVTAGIEQAILPLARHLGVRNVHAVRLFFGPGGEYAGFDRRSLLTRAGGKELVVRAVRARSKGGAVMIGDGASDLEAKSAVDLFIGFGGVHSRSVVRENADVYVHRLRDALTHILES